MTFATVLSFSWSVGWCYILLEVERLIVGVFFHLFKCWNQNILNIDICVDLNPLLHKTQRRLQDLKTAAHTMRLKDFCRQYTVLLESSMSTESQWKFCVHFVVMTHDSCFNCEEFFFRKIYLLLVWASLQFFKKNICSFKSLVLFEAVRYCLFLTV